MVALEHASLPIENKIAWLLGIVNIACQSLGLECLPISFHQQPQGFSFYRQI
jgi:hypothetical protein